MDALFAPWRMEWVTRDRSGDPDGPECPFCRLPVVDDDRENNIVARSDSSYVLLNNRPYNPGHVMTIPYEHTGEFQTLDERTVLDCMQTAQVAVQAVTDGLSPDGFNLGCNIGSAGGASINDHLHLHIIPRWESDTSFMPLTANTAIVEEAVNETYVRLRDALLDIDSVQAEDEQGAVKINHD
ncbi:HIT family protein [Haloarcula japonica]|uniref:Histidine triad (HIT) protein n=1 Tax=Haloarcula japonica (strain ATCC 49778 / DSM 6131 / JCM 7785 / NBRC 101032 / NCIMB 13157 / TR-1) TaxID=1227453 RepID=M0L0C7_HALJT|nr:HIT domain-containing protein [Haloarcula japonica]EMA26992.1 histidine triad (HIT) protein [Haloarcula japonica DSM 6131]